MSKLDVIKASNKAFNTALYIAKKKITQSFLEMDDVPNTIKNRAMDIIEDLTNEERK